MWSALARPGLEHLVIGGLVVDYPGFWRRTDEAR